MAEVHQSNQAGESAARFIEFVMLQAQNASLFLGLIPNPQSGEPEVNLDLARMFIDQLAMIGEKTRGNLSSEEAQVLRNALSQLQMAFYEVSQGKGVPGRSSRSAESLPTEQPGTSLEPPPSPTANPTTSNEAPTDTGESKKRFTKSYGS